MDDKVIGSIHEDALFFSNIERHVALTADEKKYLTTVLHAKTVPQKNVLIRQGHVCRYLFFVVSGSLRAYNLDKNGRESTIMFGVQDWWITDMYAFVNQKPALLSLETLADSRVLALAHDAFEEVLHTLPKLERFFRILFQNAYIREQQRVLDTISLSTEERYLRFIAKYPQIVERVTQKQIASYLGVTPEFLSSVKKK